MEIGSDPSEWFDRVHPRDLARVKKDIACHLSGKTPHYANEHRLRNKEGRYQWVFSRGLATVDQGGQATRIAGSFTDITRHKNMEQQLALRAFYDPLTGLPNRALFMESLGRACARLGRRSFSRFALFFLDLDGFKSVNDRLGHQAGDSLLAEFAQRLKSSVRPNDMVARMSGDEFTVLLEEIESPREAIEVAVRIPNALRAPFRFREGESVTSASIGIAYSDCGKIGPDGLLQAADQAMYLAKTSGKGRCVEYGKPVGSVSS
jgi:diguanylate cyclase (GGDEF)-like protein